MLIACRTHDDSPPGIEFDLSRQIGKSRVIAKLAKPLRQNLPAQRLFDDFGSTASAQRVALAATGVRQRTFNPPSRPKL